MMYELAIMSNERTAMIDITNKIEALVRKSDLQDGICAIFVILIVLDRET
ncbi:hypothetical protein SAMN02745118_00302 [Selenihalanaerobacter shriftii]|uniref:Uncharacterized protein n=1 Tax=Selenihalanaerobacter shriftii TaxID=142842 RepID=A0A1T4JQ00_9FIRM|nr:hypothetical protein SAMN02745118_00302 [Selenihalanaerobacter shriftii]